MNIDIGKTEYEEVRQYWDTYKSIEVVDNPEINNRECIIYCSSNGVWHPNSIDIFRKNIVEENKYEWKNLRGGTKERDLYPGCV